ncbi:MAG TPA: hypothetical protein VK158_03420, partial [Acidobacteriota bacterium]|nr:hypothetical protein [Acidobacteriota bacterium]
GLTYAEEFKKGWIRYVQYVRNPPPIEIIRNIKPLRQELVKGLLKYVDMFSQQYKAAVEEFHQEYSVSHDNVRFGYSEDLNAEGNIIRQSVKDGFVGVPNIDTRINEAFLSSNHRAEWEHSHANLVAEHSLLDAKLREGMPNNQVALQTLNFAARELQEADKALALFEHFPTFTPDHPPSIAPDKLSAITRLKQRVISNQAEQTGQQMETYILSLEKYIEDVEKLRVDVSKAATAYQRACEEFENDIIAQLQR